MFDCWKTLGYALFPESTKKEEKKKLIFMFSFIMKNAKKG